MFLTDAQIARITDGIFLYWWTKIQSTLVISKSKGPSKILRDISTSTYQTCSIEEKKLNNQNLQMTM